MIITPGALQRPGPPAAGSPLERIRARGGDPFIDYQLPEAVLKLKQGFGRLIRGFRHRPCRDPGSPNSHQALWSRFLESLPDCRKEIEEDWDDV
ncbi:MAG: hypothetical protein Ct9H300mP1_32620 [Planctomycetaceae bacterium]|nr:MAG: hypothetical protein Ct9H300mP1_32620 [Planctomycetaceae bacterium]